jgi:hypothetical protein
MTDTILLLWITMTKLGPGENELLAMFTTTTGASGVTAASKARKIAISNFDRLLPPGHKMPGIFNIMI